MSAIDFNGRTPLHWTAIWGKPFNEFARSNSIENLILDNDKCGDLLIKNGAHVNIKDKDGKTALHLSAKYGNFHAFVINMQMM